MTFCDLRRLEPVRGEIDCKEPGLILLNQRALDRLRTWPDHELLHVNRDWNGSATSLASAGLQRQFGIEAESEKEIQGLVTLDVLADILITRPPRRKATSGVRIGSDPYSLRVEVVRELRIMRIGQAQDDESWISGLKKYLVGENRDLTQEDAKVFESVAMNYEVDHSDLLFYRPMAKETAADQDKLMRLMVPEMLLQGNFASLPHELA
ncbi:reverse transcriptase [Phytophthora megakarya]|uniref:Reverse transcriptase n=1 Tax=Phytophthora megakarya TaxID=4795 RepID=A0A225VPY6_9STRA|nr:reverse transcriptase [Phytophthora megakarya]